MIVTLLSMFGCFVHSFGAEVQTNNVGTIVMKTIRNNTGRVCKLGMNTTSIDHFLSRLWTTQAHFVHFDLSIRNVNVHSDPDVFRPFHWVWTYSHMNGQDPYFISWKIEHGLLSFGLLDSKTVKLDGVQLEPKRGEADCSITIGETDSILSIINAFNNLTRAMYYNMSRIYEKNYFCYLSINSAVRQSFLYTLATYIRFPIQYINYKCCIASFNYITREYDNTCDANYVKVWSRLFYGSYILGVIFFLYLPIVLFELGGWLATDEKLTREDYDHVLSLHESASSLDIPLSTDWIYLDGTAPLTVFTLIGSIKTPLMTRFPRAVSRLRRLFVLLGLPLAVVGVELLLYRKGMGADSKITVSELVKHGSPMGFVSLLADNKDAAKVFVPSLGGPNYFLLAYFILGPIFTVLPNSLKQIVEVGMPSNRKGSPLFFGTREIIEMALGGQRFEYGYKKACALFKCSFYMLFRKVFWIRMFTIQASRFQFIRSVSNTRFVSCICCIIIYPFMFILSILEVVTCLLFYGFPFFSYLAILIRGMSKTFLNMQSRNRHFQCLLHNRLFAFVSVALITVACVYFLYILCLIFLESMSFVAEVILYCFVAMILYPCIAFGYLFFLVSLVYYLIRLIHNFGETYLQLLAVTVEKSLELEQDVNHITIYNSELTISNVKTANLTGIRINNKLLNIPQNSLQDIVPTWIKVMKHKNMNGIPKALFDQIVNRYKPVHVQFLKLLFHLILITALIVTTNGILVKYAVTSTSELSDTMHVIFVVTVGVLPRMLEIAFSNESEVVKRDIEGKNIEQSILEYWRDSE